MYLVHKESESGMKISGTTAWGEVWSVITVPSGDPIGVDALYVGFFVSEADANNIASALGRIAELEGRNTLLDGNFEIASNIAIGLAERYQQELAQARQRIAELRNRVVSAQSGLEEDAEAGIRASAGALKAMRRVEQWIEELFPNAETTH